MKKTNKMLVVFLVCIVFTFGINYANEGQNDYDDFDSVEVIVVYKIPRENKNVNWYEIGLSRNGSYPVEYIWRAKNNADGYIIIGANIGDRGTIFLRSWAKESEISEIAKLPRPNAENPPIIGVFGEVYWVEYK